MPVNKMHPHLPPPFFVQRVWNRLKRNELSFW